MNCASRKCSLSGDGIKNVKMKLHVYQPVIDISRFLCTITSSNMIVDVPKSSFFLSNKAFHTKY